MAQCITCGTELHPERAQKYNYCMAPKCQEKNAKGLTIVAVGVNKSADQFVILDERTREELASGKYRDPRREGFGASAGTPAGVPAGTPVGVPTGTPAPPSPPEADADTATRPEPARRPGRPRPTSTPAPRRPVRRPWSRSQEKLAVIYNEQGLRPDEIAQKLGLSTYAVTQIILASRNRGKL